ncbi:MAG: L-threonylcarbamoyladenylate synthase [Candidatus Delongbacteria bacterium]|jgi:L-threonylcarbamoyladenylate synthase|nr:L-threonylcarbamoyladenylate synthase [Candidatus Delongbacteria bacterium]
MITQAELNNASKIIAGGGIVILPTDTIYGLSCDPENKKALERLDGLKGRDKKPYIILDSSHDRLGKYIRLNKFVLSFISYISENGLWPGNITVVAGKNPEIKYSFLKDSSKIAVRLTDFYTIKHITDSLGGGIVSTSVNASGGESLNDPDLIIKTWGDKADLILKGECSGNRASTIVELFTDEEAIKFLRSTDNYIITKIKNKFREIE